MNEFETNNHQYDEILGIILALSRETNYEKLLDIILTKMMEITNSDAGTLYIVQDSKLHFRIVKNMTVGINQSIKDTSMLPPIDLDSSNIENVSAYVALQQMIVIINDINTDPRFTFSGHKIYDRITGYDTKSMLVLPLSLYGDGKPELVGVLQLLNAKDKKTGEVVSYSDVDDSVLMAISNIGASVLSNFLHNQENDKLFNSLVDVTTQAIAERSAYSKSHTHNVSNYCKAFAVYLNNRFSLGERYYFTESEIEEIALSALLHDIGKIITPLDIMDKSDFLGPKIHDIRYRFAIKGLQLENSYLKGNITQEVFEEQKVVVKDMLALIEYVNSSSVPTTEEQLEKIRMLGFMTYTQDCGTVVPILKQEELDALSIRFGTLTDKERKIMQDHVMVTGRLLEKIAFPGRFKKAPRWAANHHEFLDGSGYPKGLTGDEIDIGSRILTIMDIFDALISNDRPYKKGIPVNEALKIICQMADNGKLDKELVLLFTDSNVWESI